MVKMNCIVVDDEVMGRKLLEENLKQIPFLNRVGSCSNAFEAMELLQKEQVDLLFLDIQMPGLSGLQFISSLEVRPMVIFVTAYKIEDYKYKTIEYFNKEYKIIEDKIIAEDW